MSAFYGIPTGGGGGGSTALDDLAVGATDGSVIFADDTGLGEDNGSFFWDRTEKRLGIGTDSPDAALHVTQDARDSESSAPELKVVAAAHTNVEDPDVETYQGSVLFDLSATVQFEGDDNNGNAYAFRILRPTFAVADSAFLNELGTVWIQGPPKEGSGISSLLNDTYALVIAGDDDLGSQGKLRVANNGGSGGNSPAIVGGAGDDVGINFRSSRIDFIQNNKIFGQISPTKFILKDDFTSLIPSGSSGVLLGEPGNSWKEIHGNRLALEGRTGGTVDELFPVLSVKWTVDIVAGMSTVKPHVHFDLDDAVTEFDDESLGGTIAESVGFQVDGPDWGCDGTGDSITVTDAATMKITPPSNSTGEVTYTNKYAIWSTGDVRVDGVLKVEDKYRGAEIADPGNPDSGFYMWLDDTTGNIEFKDSDGNTGSIPLSA